jgi:hypothetical protein
LHPHRPGFLCPPRVTRANKESPDRSGAEAGKIVLLASEASSYMDYYESALVTVPRLQLASLKKTPVEADASYAQ